jgi:YesN/AraC family two-component response regulator
MESLCELYGEYIPRETICEMAQKIKYKSNKQILAASKILEACTSYILQRELVKPAKKQMLEKIDTYIDDHLSEKITIDTLCNEFSISRTRLYDLMGKQLSGGIASFIKQKRLAHYMERAATYDFFKLLNFRKQSTSNRSARKITAEEIAIIKSKLFVIAHILFS